MTAVVVGSALLLEGAEIDCRTNPFANHNFSSEFRVKTWTSEEGLPQNTVLSLLQTSEGYIWIGTLDGLLRFDGRKFTLYDQQNTPAFRNHAVTCLAESPGGALWIGTPNGLLLYSNHVFKPFLLTPSPFHVRSICARKAGGLWLATESGPARFEDGEIFFYTNYPSYKWPPTGAVGKGIGSVLEDQDGTLWIADGRGLLRLAPSSHEFEIVFSRFPGIGYREIGANKLVRDSEGSIWFGNADGLYSWHHGQIQFYPAKANGFQGVLDPLCWDARSGLWIETDPGGITRFQDGKFFHYVPGTGLSDERVYCVLADREANVWLGTRAGGLNQAQIRRLLSLTTGDGLANNDVWSISQGPDGAVWVATAGGLSRYRDGRFKTYLTENVSQFPSAPSCRFVLADHSGRVWAGSGLGLSEVDSEQMVRAPPAVIGDFSTFLSPECLYEDTSGALWVGAGNLWRCKDQKWAVWDRVDARMPSAQHILPSPTVIGILHDPLGNVWVGTKAGICRFKGEESQRFTRENGFPGDVARPALADADGTVWFAADNGLILFRHNAFFLVSTRNGLFEDLAYNVLEDDLGWVWLNGNRGLQRLRKQDVKDLADGKTQWVQCLHYGTSDGMLSSEGNGLGLPNSCKTREGQLWFPTTKGVVVVDPRTLKNNDVPPAIVIEQVLANGQPAFGDGVQKTRLDARNHQTPQLENGRLRFGPGQARSVIIRYSANSFISPERIRFQYRLEGHDPGWQEDNSNLRTAVYTDLRPGNYCFRVRAFNNNGVPSSADAQFAFSVAPRFYETRSFFLFCAATVLLLAVSAHQFRLAGVRRIKELEQLHALDQERARIAKDMHDSLGADLSRIAMLTTIVQGQGASGPINQTQLERVSTLARGLVHGIGELVWATNPRNNTLDNVAAYFREYASELLEPAGVQVTFRFPDSTPAIVLAGEVRRHLFLALKEALNNVLKHAQASEVVVQLSLSESAIEMSIRDNGRGLNGNGARKANGLAGGNGLRNLQDRLASVGGRTELDSEPGKGTGVRLSVPLTSAAAVQQERS